MDQRNIPIGQLLVNKGMITPEQLEQALDKQKQVKGVRLGDIILQMGLITERDLLKALSERLHVPVVDLNVIPITDEALQKLPEEMARKFQAIPVDYEDGFLTVAINDPLDFHLLNQLQVLCNVNINTVLATKDDLTAAIDRCYSATKLQSALGDINKEIAENDDNSQSGREMTLAEQRVDNAPIVKLVNSIIVQAYNMGASDIHIEPMSEETVVRFRIDGDLIRHMAVSSEAHNAIVTRLKIQSNLNIAEKRVPQDGRFEQEMSNGRVDIRVSTLPTLYGEKVVLRILGNLRDHLETVENLGMDDYNRAIYDSILKCPAGIVLVTGPTGSGKTTTLYATLREIGKPNLNVVTIEDPVEIHLPGINQVQVNPKAGLTFAGGLRSILRQDPDIIMVGEIRDSETAEIAMRAAITGHQVLSTIHTNDAALAVARLMDMGVEPYLVAAALSGVVAQRLVKQLCPSCREAYEADLEEQKVLGLEGPVTLYRSRGCQNCGYSGHKGRVAVYEIIAIDSQLRQMIMAHCSGEDIRRYAAAHGTHFLLDGMRQLVLDGQTDIGELLRITYTIG